MPNTKTKDWVEEAIETAHQEVSAAPAARRLMVEEMMDIITQGIMVLSSRDGAPVTSGMARERARNITGVLINTFAMTRLP